MREATSYQGGPPCGCCGGGAGDCIPPTHDGCPCAPGCGLSQCLRYYATGDLSPFSHVLYQRPYQACCGGSRAAWSLRATFLYLDKATCSGLCVGKKIEVQGSGVGPGRVNVTVWTTQHVPCGLEVLARFSIPTSGAICDPYHFAESVIDQIPAVYGLSGAYSVFATRNFWGTIPPNPPTMEVRSESQYADCATLEQRLWIQFVGNGQNPCAGIAVQSEVDAAVEAVDCIPTGAVCGACCCDGRCYDSINPSDCSAMGGEFQGDGTLCSRIICPTSRRRGACCLLDGSCVLITQGDCAARQGVFHGVGSECAGVICPPAVRACCFPGGGCSETTQAICLSLGGTWLSQFQNCTPTLCQEPIVTCCYPDGSCDNTHTGSVCQAGGGTPLPGPARPCNPNPCVGACCVYPNQSCPQHDPYCSEPMSESQCAANIPPCGATTVYQGGGSTCATVNCNNPGPIRIATGAQTMDVAAGKRPRGCSGCGKDGGL